MLPSSINRRLQFEKVNDVVVFRFLDEKFLDEAHGFAWFSDAMDHWVDVEGCRKVVLDFVNVEFMSSAMLGKLIMPNRKLERLGGKLVLCNIVADIMNVFQITKLDRILTVIPGTGIGAADIARDVFGGSISFTPDWRTDTVLMLARQMYEAREFSAMPILADALQDAGCDNDDILNHCRGDGPHVRGCWVCDLVLGKE